MNQIKTKHGIFTDITDLQGNVVMTAEENYKQFLYRQEHLDEILLKEKKQEKIKQSKETLSKWLEENPLKSSAHNGEAAYTVTQEKQMLLTQNLMIAQLNNSETTTWNSRGCVCEEWTVQELSQLAFEIEEYLRPRIKKQQSYEVEINNCSTVEEVEAIEIEYETIN